MRALWSDAELQKGLTVDWTFEPGDVMRIGERLSASRCEACSKTGQFAAHLAD